MPVTCVSPLSPEYQGTGYSTSQSMIGGIRRWVTLG